MINPIKYVIIRVSPNITPLPNVIKNKLLIWCPVKSWKKMWLEDQRVEGKVEIFILSILLLSLSYIRRYITYLSFLISKNNGRFKKKIALGSFTFCPHTIKTEKYVFLSFINKMKVKYFLFLNSELIKKETQFINSIN